MSEEVKKKTSVEETVTTIPEPSDKFAKSVGDIKKPSKTKPKTTKFRKREEK